MRFRLIAVGKVKQGDLRASLDDYLGRIRRYCPCDEVELRDGSPAEVAARFRKAIPDRSRVVALEVLGKRLTSPDLAAYVQRGELDAVPNLVWLVGGAYGLPPEVSKAADMQMSLSAMTLPHRLARVVLAEQLYRAFTILRDEPYSH